MKKRSIEEVLKEQTPKVMSLPGVVGTAIGKSNGRDCIIVLVQEMNQELTDAIPDSLDGYSVVISEIGEIKARDPR